MAGFVGIRILAPIEQRIGLGWRAGRDFGVVLEKKNFTALG